LQRKAEEERMAAKTAAQGGDYVSSDEEDTRGAQIEIGQSKVKDIKQKKKEQELAKDAKSEQEFTWTDLNRGIQGSQSAGAPVAATASAGSQATGGAGAAKREEKPHPDGKGGFARDQKPTGFGASQSAPTNQFQKDGITFSKGRPTFKKTESVAAKGDFPELGDTEAKKQELSKAAIGGPIGQVSAPAKGARTQNKFDGFNEDEKRKPAAPVEEQKSDAPKERPKFTGSLKGLLNR